MHRFVVLLIISLCAQICPAQDDDRYFEYHNRGVKKITVNRLKLLLGKTWYAVKWEHILRGDTTTGYKNWMLNYLCDSVFLLNGDSGRWYVRTGKYLIQKPRQREEHHESAFRQNYLRGIFGIRSLTDTSLVLEKILTSSADMKNVFYFSSRPARVGNYGGSTFTVRNPFYNRSGISDAELDSISRLSAQQLFQSNIQVLDNDRLLIRDARGTYLIKWKGRRDGLTKIFGKTETPAGAYYTQQRFIPDQAEIAGAERFFENYLQNELRYPADFSIGGYNRQYLGFINDNGDKSIIINAWCGQRLPAEPDFVVEKNMYSHYFNVTVNLTRHSIDRFRAD